MPLPRPAPGTTRWWVIGIVGCLAAVGVIVWWGIVTTAGSVRPEVTAYRVESDTSIVVEYDLHRPAGVAVLCRITALDGGRNRVGTVDDSVPATGPDVGAPGGVAAHQRAGRDRRRRLVHPGARHPLTPGPAGRARDALPWWRSGPGLVGLALHHLGSGSDTRAERHPRNPGPLP